MLSRTLKIFISSPGDVIPEREVARKVIGELNEEMMGKVFLAGKINIIRNTMISF